MTENRKSSRPAGGVDPRSSRAAQENLRFPRTVDHAKVRRAADVVGRKLERERRVRIGQRRGRFYGPEDLGALCAAGCGTRIVLALQEAGITEHPSCDRAAVRRGVL